MDEIQQEEPKKPKKNRSLIVIVILLIVIAGMFFWIVGYWMGQNKKGQIASPGPTATPSLTPKLITATADDYEGWNTYESQKYSLKFKYPRKWDYPDAEEIKKSEDSMAQVDFTELVFRYGSDVMASVQLSKIGSYDSHEDTGNLLNVYKTKSALGANEVWLPHANAGILAASSPKYIESNDGNYRGICYFANIGQAYSTQITALVVMTDGLDNIFQLSHTANSSEKDAYPCISEKIASCTQDEVESDAKKFKDYVQNLEDSSPEPAVKEFNSTLKKIAQSLKQY